MTVPRVWTDWVDVHHKQALKTASSKQVDVHFQDPPKQIKLDDSAGTSADFVSAISGPTKWTVGKHVKVVDGTTFGFELFQ